MMLGLKLIPVKILAALLLVTFATAGFAADANHDKLAKCLTAKKATMYGDFRCRHCAEQKALFGESMQYVAYVECGTPGKPMNLQSQQQVCRDLQITKYPTWIFSDGERWTNVQPLEKLAEKAGCKVE